MHEHLLMTLSLISLLVLLKREPLIVVIASEVSGVTTHDCVSETVVSRLLSSLLLRVDQVLGEWMRMSFTDGGRFLLHKPAQVLAFEMSL